MDCMPHAVITGASLGLGRALAVELAKQGWTLTIDARHPEALDRVADELSALTKVQAVPGDVSDPAHRASLIAAVGEDLPVDLLVNNASDLGGSPLPRLRDLQAAAYERAWRVNVLAPHQLIQALLPRMSPGAAIVNISSDAGAEHYEGWGGYGSTKAALDHQTATWAVEEPGFSWYSIDPGDMRTAMHQAAYPGEDIGDRPDPETVAPRLLEIVTSGRPSGRYVA